MPNDYLTTAEVADYLRLKERKVYDLVRQGHIPCSRATGKLLFPRQHIDMWVLSHLEGDQAQRHRRWRTAQSRRSSSGSRLRRYWRAAKTRCWSGLCERAGVTWPRCVKAVATACAAC